MNRRYALPIITALILAAVALALLGVLAPVVRIAVAVPFTLLLPGYAFTAALFPRKELAPLEAVLLSIGMSIVLVILLGLVLNATPWGLQTVTWIASLAAITVCAGAVALGRDGLPRVDARAIPAITRSALYPIMLLALAAVVLVAGAGVAVYGEAQQPHVGFTQLWIVGVPQAASNPKRVQIGITSSEPATTTYRLVLTQPGRTLGIWPHITLAPTKSWQKTVALPTGLPRQGRIVATLYRILRPQAIYRRVWLQHA